MKKVLIKMAIAISFSSFLYSDVLIPNKQCALIVASTDSISEAKDYINNEISNTKYVNVYKSVVGLYEISIGFLKSHEIDTVMKKWIRDEKIPKNSWCASSAVLVSEIDLDNHTEKIDDKFGRELQESIARQKLEILRLEAIEEEKRNQRRRADDRELDRLNREINKLEYQMAINRQQASSSSYQRSSFNSNSFNAQPLQHKSANDSHAIDVYNEMRARSNARNSTSGYTSSSGGNPKYDLSNPIDRHNYSTDLSAQHSDSTNLNQQMDRGMGQYGGGY